jgi:hypothetical protein
VKKAISKLLTGVVAACALPLGAAGLDPPEAVGVCLKALLTQPEESRATLLSAQTLSADAMQTALWDIKGHLYTAGLLTLLGDTPSERRFALSYYSQYPDLDSDYEAVPVAIKYLLVPTQYDWRNDITGVLHSLHGGRSPATEQRRSRIREALDTTLQDKSKDWLSGLLIHAWGDSYAHTRNDFGTESERAYGPWVGHLLPSLVGNSPDDVKDERRKRKYIEYANALYRAIPKGDSANDAAFNAYLNDIAERDCAKHECPVFQPPTETPREPGPLESEMRRLKDCMDENARALTRTEIQQAIDLIH